MSLYFNRLEQKYDTPVTKKNFVALTKALTVLLSNNIDIQMISVAEIEILH